jgi:amidohydrolase
MPSDAATLATTAFTPEDIAEAAAFRRHLHAMPEVSGEEEATASEVATFLAGIQPDQILTGLGGHGVAAVFDSFTRGPSVLLRSELDALPIQEISDAPHRSRVPGKGHLCGHDGHTASLALIARALGRQRPARGRIILMFQPAEENGSGARAVTADPAFDAIRPDISFSWHNMPGIPFGHVWLGEGVANCASRGMKISLTGKTAHAAQPENGVSPMQAISALMPALTALGSAATGANRFAMATLTHASMGAPAFGIAPGHAEIWVTLRTFTDDAMGDLVARAEALARVAADANGLDLAISHHDIFAHVENAPEAVAHLARALDGEGLAHMRGDLPFRASEDFGIFGKERPAAMFFLGAGERHPSLHNPDYDYPDELTPLAAGVMLRAALQVLDSGR